MRHVSHLTLALVRAASIAAAITFVLTAPPGGGEAVAQDRVVIDAQTKARRGLYPIAIPAPAGDTATAETVRDVLSFDLTLSSWFRVLDPRSFLADLAAEGMGIDPKRWRDVGAFGVVKAEARGTGGRVTLTFKLYEVDKGAVPVLEREYSGAAGDVRKLVHRFGNEVVQHFTGEPGFFGSRITFSDGKRIVVMDFDGHGPYSVTNNGSINVLPAFSPSGSQLAYTSFMRGNPDVYLAPTGGGVRAKRLSRQNGMNTGASWSPDGSKIAVTLSRDGNPEIYVISAADGSIITRLTNNRYIDTSPAWSPDGSEIAFVSNREGSPQVFVMSAGGGDARRVTTVGNWNQTPAWCPKKGTRLLAYTARDDASSRFDIVTVDLAAGKLTRITQNEGNNEEPTWASNCRAVAFSSKRTGGSGIYIANADGTGQAKQIFKGGGTSPDWGPVPQQ